MVQPIPVYGSRLYTLRHATRAFRLAWPAAAAGRINKSRSRRVRAGWAGRGRTAAGPITAGRITAGRIAAGRITAGRTRNRRARPRGPHAALGPHAAGRDHLPDRPGPQVRHRGGRLARLMAARGPAERR